MEEKSKINNLKINNIPQTTSVQKQPIMEGELTGYPSIDKPWNKFYRQEPIRNIKLNQTIYSMVFNRLLAWCCLEFYNLGIIFCSTTCSRKKYMGKIFRKNKNI